MKSKKSKVKTKKVKLSADTLRREARKVAKLLSEKKKKLVLAESCTGGLISALLVEIPGISANLCGSFVVYRNESKIRWLGVHRAALDHYSDVSDEVAREMARGALIKTPEADIAAAITGHLGPSAPDGQDGLIFVAVATRKHIEVHQVWLEHNAPPKTNSSKALRLRSERQMLASQVVLQVVRALLSAT